MYELAVLHVCSVSEFMDRICSVLSASPRSPGLTSCWTSQVYNPKAIGSEDKCPEGWGLESCLGYTG